MIKAEAEKLNKRPGGKKSWLWIAIGIVAVLLIVIVIGGLIKKGRGGRNAEDKQSVLQNDKQNKEERKGRQSANETADPKETDKFITASPVDITQVKSVGKYRSCSGHEYSGTNFDGQSEVSSSMKHYITPVASLSHTTDKIKVYAPFDGIIARIDPSDTWRGRQFVIEHKPFNGWYWTYVHISINGKVVEGTEVKSGELLGYANLSSGGENFDMSLQRFKERQNPYSGDEITLYSNLEPVFGHMVDSVYAPWSARGVTAENSVISKAERDAKPCPCKDNNPGSTMCQYEFESNTGGTILLK